MRIIAGEFRSRPLFTPADGEITRPIPDRVKESLFSILRGHLDDAVVFDGFAGTGAIGLEALSRGAARCVFVEKDKRIAAILQRNIDALAVRDRAELVVGDVLGAGALARCPLPVNLAFLDPPYPLTQDPIGFKRIMAQLGALIQRLDPSGYAILRTPWPFFLEVPDAPAQPAPEEKARKERRAKERDRALLDPIRAEHWSQRSAQARHTPAPKAPVPVERAEDSGDQNGLPDEEAAEIDPTGTPEEIKARLTKIRPKLQRLEADLALPGARGPETHVYGSMAIHLYMRA